MCELIVNFKKVIFLFFFCWNIVVVQIASSVWLAVCLSICLSLSFKWTCVSECVFISLSIYIYIFKCICVVIYIYIYVCVCCADSRLWFSKFEFIMLIFSIGFAFNRFQKILKFVEKTFRTLPALNLFCLLWNFFTCLK